MATFATRLASLCQLPILSLVVFWVWVLTPLVSSSKPQMPLGIPCRLRFMLNLTVVFVIKFIQLINLILGLISIRFLFVTNENFEYSVKSKPRLYQHISHSSS